MYGLKAFLTMTAVNLDHRAPMSEHTFGGRHMRLVLLAVLPLLLAACGLPTGVNIAMYALDGITLVSSGRTTTDHMISAVMKKDCVVFRIVKDQVICRELEQTDGKTLVVMKQP